MYTFTDWSGREGKEMVRDGMEWELRVEKPCMK
jgi:hypothetical protein